MRELCLQCRRAVKVCWCGRLEPFRLGFDLDLLMHPRESRVTVGTGRMVHRFVRGSRLFVGASFEDDHRVWRDHDGPTWLLFPGPDALDLDGGAPSDLSIFERLDLRDKRLRVVVVDGTWTTARRIVRDSPRLLALPRLALTPRTPARYHAIRREPTLTCHSTLEAVWGLVERLDVLGVAAAPEGRAHDRMLTMLDALVSEQVGFVPPEHLSATRGRREAPGQREARGPTMR